MPPYFATLTEILLDCLPILDLRRDLDEVMREIRTKQARRRARNALALALSDVKIARLQARVRALAQRERRARQSSGAQGLH